MTDQIIINNAQREKAKAFLRMHQTEGMFVIPNAWDAASAYIYEPESWGARPYDLAALAAYYMGLYSTALSYGREALAQEPENGRLRKNLEFYEAAAAKM